MVNIQDIDTTKQRQGCRATGIHIHCWWELKMVQPLWQTDWYIFTKLKILLLYDPTTVLLHIYLNALKIQVYT